MMVSDQAIATIVDAAHILGGLSVCSEITRALVAVAEHLDQDDREALAGELLKLSAALVTRPQLH